MGKKIISWCVFAVGLVAIALAIAFVIGWNGKIESDEATADANKKLYKAVGILNQDESGKKILDEFATVKTDNVKDFENKLRDSITNMEEKLKVEEQNSKDFYCYLNTLKALNAKEFNKFKSNFPRNLQGIIHTNDNGETELNFDEKGKYQKEFKNIKSYDELSSYLISTLSPEYTSFRQSYLAKDEIRNAEKQLLTTIENITKINDPERKKEALATAQDDVQSSISMDKKMLTPAFVLIYVMFIIAMAAVVIFILINIFSNFKTSYKGLLAFVALIVLAFITYALASPDVTNDVFTKLSITPEGGRYIEGICYLTYTMFAIAILVLIVSPIVSAIKTNMNLKK